MTREKRRIVLAISGGLVTLGVVGSVVVDRPAGGWAGAMYQARLLYLAHVPPLVWPRDAFSVETWAQTPVEGRYRLVKSLLSSTQLKGRTPSEVERLLGGRVDANAKQRLFPLRKAGVQKLWWVLVLEFEGGRVAEARRDIAWLDP